MKNEIFVGRRKTSVARVYLNEGNGEILVNKKPIDKYFSLEIHKQKLNFPFVVTETIGKYNVYVNIQGGGVTGQSEAAQLAIARALSATDESLKSKLRSANLLTRDSRMVERKKYGQPGARKKFQFSKR